MNWHYTRLNVANDGVSLVTPHPQAPDAQVGYIVAKVCYSTCDGKPTADSLAWAKIISAAVNEWAARNPETVKAMIGDSAPTISHASTWSDCCRAAGRLADLCVSYVPPKGRASPQDMANRNMGRDHCKRTRYRGTRVRLTSG